MSNMKNLQDTAVWMRKRIVEMTTHAGSGHPTSSLSGVELMVTLFFHDRGFFRYHVQDPENGENDRLIFSKGHASPLYYSLWAAAGGIDAKELLTFREFGSRLEGHPTRNFPFTEVPTGSLGQGLAVGAGEAIAIKQQILGDPQQTKTAIPRVYVLLGDSEIAEGSVWEAARIAAYYRLGNLTAIVDVNRLGQRGETMDGWDIEKIAQRFEAFGWRAIIVDGHDIEAVTSAYEMVLSGLEVPTVIVAKTVKGKGVSFLENKNGWHGKVLSKDELEQALKELGDVDETIQGTIQSPETHSVPSKPNIGKQYKIRDIGYSIGDTIATRKIYGVSLVEVAQMNDHIVALDAEVSNSTYAIDFAKVFPERFFEMFIAEQTMVGVAVGMARRGLIPFASTFGTFFSRAFDQLRMAQYADVPLVCVGSHVGVSIGEDGASQMGLEDIGMFRMTQGSVVLYPSDAVSMRGCILLAAQQKGISYIRTTRAETPVLYHNAEEFVVGGSKTLRESGKDVVTVVAAGITLHETLKAYEVLQEEGISIRVIDAYSVKPIDVEVLKKAVRETKVIVTVEDHYRQSGLGDAVREALSEEKANIISLAVTKRPCSGTPEKLLRYEEIDARAIVETVKDVLEEK